MRMASPVDHFMMPPTVRWYYNRVRDAVVVATTTTTYTLLHVGRLNNLAELPPGPTPADLPEFLRPPLTRLGQKFMPKVEPISEHEPLLEYIPLPELRPMSPNFPPLEPIALEVPIPVIEIRSSNSPTLAVKPR